MPPRQPPVVGLALRGIANTLRARWSAPHRRDGGEDVDAAIMWGAGKTPRIWWIALEGGSLGSFLVGFSGDLLRLKAGDIDQMARQLGLAEPQPGQVGYPSGRPDSGAPALAQNVSPAPAAQ